MLRYLIGDRAFYKKIIMLSIPIMIQNGITNFVNMLDNIMIGSCDTSVMTGVAVANQLIFVFNLCVFGAVSGAGIFTAQFFGSGDNRGVMHTFRFKLLFCCLLALAGIGIFIFGGESLLRLYLNDEKNAAMAIESLSVGKKYLSIMLIGLLPYTLSQCFGSTLRETGKPSIPMLAGVMAVAVNLSLNYVLIFGKLGAPRLEAEGAAIATVISRFAELGFLVIYSIVKRKKYSFLLGVFKGLYVPMSLIGKIIKKGMPLMVNEAMWAGGIAFVNQCYSVRGIDVVAANNISQTFFNVFSVAFMAVGVAIGIVLGHELGSGNTREAKRTAARLIVFSVFVSIIVSAVYFIAARFIPDIYHTTDEVKELAVNLMRITALAMPIDAFAHASYFTLRSGGKVLITLLFDSVFVWIVSVSSAYLIVHYTALPILAIYAIVQGLNILKCILGYIFVKKGAWIKTIIS